jgi:hypothetical protein
MRAWGGGDKDHCAGEDGNEGFHDYTLSTCCAWAGGTVYIA